MPVLDEALKLSAALAKSAPLDFPSEKSFLLFFAHEKGQDTCFKDSSVVLQFFFYVCRHKPKKMFGQTTRVDSDRKCKFQRFCPARSDCNNVAHGILSFYKLQGVFSQFTDKIWKLQLKYFSYKRDQRRAFSSTVICISKFTNLNERATSQK